VGLDGVLDQVGVHPMAPTLSAGGTQGLIYLNRHARCLSSIAVHREEKFLSRQNWWLRSTLATLPFTLAILPFTLAILLVAGCAAPPGPSDAELAEVVQKTDWSRARHVRIVLRDAGFAPTELRLRAGEPYRLTIENQGANNHYFNAPEFFASIAARKAEVAQHAEIKAPRFSSFELHAAGGFVDVYFVPLEKGRFRAHCHLGNHAEMGVEGVLVVE